MPLLFSYGTLQQEAVQMSVFGRALRGQPDEVVGFEHYLLTVDEANGRNTYSILRFNGSKDSRVRGVVFEISESELAKADEYEPPPYTRVAAMLASGKEAWVYADACSH
jgi:gamma-glutamylcyclotransferase (GGCT)/AIG2-like uncharacterized protein YtfP